MKKFALIMLVGALALSAFAACDTPADNESKDDSSKIESVDNSGSKADEESNGSVADAKVDLTVICNTVKAQVAAQSAFELDADTLFNDTGINPEFYNNYFWLIDTSEECVGVFEAKDETSLNEIKGLLEGYLQNKKTTYESYDAKVFEMANKAVIKTVGNYAYIVMSPNVTPITLTLDEKLA